ncbi:MAG: cache domain-containing protein [Pseudobdellovibrio sp.]
MSKLFNNWKSLLTSTVYALISTLPFVFLFLYFTMPAFEEKVTQNKKQNTQIAVESVFNILSYYDTLVEKKEITLEVAKLKAQEVIKTLRYNSTEYFWINDSSQIMIMHPIKPDLNGKDLSEMKDPTGKKIFVEMTQVSLSNPDGGYVDYMWPKPSKDQPQPKTSFVKLFKPWGWVVGSGVYMDDVQEEIILSRNKNLKAFFFVTFISLMILLANAVKQLFKVVIPIQNAMTNLRQESIELSATANQLAEAANTIEQSTSTQSSSMHQTSSAIVQINSMIDKTKEQAEQSQTTVAQVKASAQKGFSTISELSKLLTSISNFSVQAAQQIEANLQKMNNIDNIIKEISNKTKSIDEIVFQTKLLSFNASVEAARAGESGRGFSVVAEEIGNLARKSGESAKEISAIISESTKEVTSISNEIKSNTEKLFSEIQSRVVEGTSFAQECNEILQQVLDISSDAAIKSQNILTSTSEISIGSAEISTAMYSIENTTRENLQSVHITTIQSKKLLEQSSSLEELMENLKKIA